ncbi:type I-F CRISPR-associated endoribonuclease Cas6/Csy4 [Serratia sp. IR-2025]
MSVVSNRGGRSGQLQERPTPGVFSFYGLSASATVPWF